MKGYTHIGSYLYISEENSIHKEVGFWFKFVDYVDGTLNSLKEKGIDAIEDHNMGKYLRDVQEWNIQED